jgi:hypothetical protein
MNTAEEQISCLYHNGINLDEAVELLQHRNISAELVKSTYDELFKSAKKFHYYAMEIKGDSFNCNVSYWTSRYFIIYRYYTFDSAFHEIEIIDSFNDKTM